MDMYEVYLDKLKNEYRKLWDKMFSTDFGEEETEELNEKAEELRGEGIIVSITDGGDVEFIMK